jgi:Rrf2 family cysteine metabolism transcriptional repressor
MIQLAGSERETPVLMSDIAEYQGFSRKYLHALLTALKDAGLVRSVRGAKGGYLIAREPETIRVGEVFKALEGIAAVVDCLDNGDKCPRSDDCAARGMWRELNDAIVDVLDRTTLADLVHKDRISRTGENVKDS